MELIQVGEKTYYIKNPVNIGIYKINEKDVFLIDSGNHKDAGKKILKITDREGWNVRGIISTHSHADHIGGNRIIQERTGCPVYAFGAEKSFAEFPILESSFLYGASPVKDLKNKFLLAEASVVSDVDGNLPEGLEYFLLKGHSFDMIGIRTDDDVFFLADSLCSEETISKYHLFFIYDVREYLGTLDYLASLDGRMFIPSHCEASHNIKELIEINRKKINETAERIYSFCENPVTTEEILKMVFDEYALVINPNQFVLIGSTVRAYLTYLYENEKVFFEFTDNKMYWKQYR